MKILILTILSLSCFFTLPSCSKNSAYPSEKKQTLLVSLAPYQSLVKRVAGEAFEVQTAVPAGLNPHAYEPTAKQVGALSHASIWFQMGEPFEKKVLAVLERRNPSLLQVDLLQGIDLIEDPSFCSCPHARDHQDRHTWLSPKIAAVQIDAIEKALSKAFPEKEALFLANASQLKEELALLDEQIRDLLSPLQDRTLLVSHPAFGYFCREYQLEQLSVEFEGKDPRPKHLEEVMQKAAAHRAELALALPQHNNKGVRIIAQRLHLPVRMIDPYSPDYFETLLLLAHMIADPEYQP